MTDDHLLPQATDDPTIVAGRYELERSLGSGGMGEVFVATDLTLDRPVAFKRLPVALTRRSRRAQALPPRSAGARADQRSATSCRCSTPEKTTGRPFLVMELVPGATVADELALGRALHPRAESVGDRRRHRAGGLAAAHAQGIVHRDVKPSNIFLTPEGPSRRSATSASRALERGDMTLTMTGQAFGSPPYIAPEQATGGTVDARADSYSLGCVLYHMLAGHPPFEGDDSVAVTYQHVHTVAPTLEELGVGVSPPELSTLVASLMRKDPSARPEVGRRRADGVRVELGGVLELRWPCTAGPGTGRSDEGHPAAGQPVGGAGPPPLGLARGRRSAGDRPDRRRGIGEWGRSVDTRGALGLAEGVRCGFDPSGILATTVARDDGTRANDTAASGDARARSRAFVVSGRSHQHRVGERDRRVASRARSSTPMSPTK